MSRSLFAGAAIAALMSVGAANAQAGYVGAIYTDVDTDIADGASGYAAEGAVAFGNSVVFEVDGMLSDADESSSTASVTGHVYMRTGAYLVGGYLGYTDNDMPTLDAGVEANWYMERLTLAGAAGHAELDTGGFDVDGYGFSAEARMFPTDNVRLQAGVGWATADVGYVDDLRITTYSVGGEVRIGEGPISALLGWQHVDASDIDVSVDAISVGVRYNWGGSLFERDRSGPSQGHASIGSSIIF